MSDTVTMHMRKTKETKGTVVFTEMIQDDERPHTFYILKSTFGELGEPDTLNVTLEPLHTGTGA